MRRPLASRLVWPALLAVALLATGAGGQASEWRQHTPLPDPRSEVAAATATGEIVVVGGLRCDRRQLGACGRLLGR